MNSKFRDYFRQYMYYGIISMLVVVALAILPMIDTSGKVKVIDFGIGKKAYQFPSR